MLVDELQNQFREYKIECVRKSKCVHDGNCDTNIQRYDSENSKSDALAREERVYTDTPPPNAESDVPASVMKSATISVSLFTVSRPAVCSGGPIRPSPPMPFPTSLSDKRCFSNRIFSSFCKIYQICFITTVKQLCVFLKFIYFKS